MSKIVSGIVGISAILFLVNAITHGMVWDHLMQVVFSSDPAKEQMRDSLQCAAGVFLWTPTVSWLGITLPAPSLADVVIAGSSTLMVLFLIFVFGIDHNWKHTLIIFAVSWIVIKYAGFFLMHYADTNCVAVVDEMNAFYSMVGGVLSLLGIGSVWKLFRAYKKI